MPRIDIKIDFDVVSAAGAIRAASREALKEAGVQALEDSTKHAPKDQGTLESSGRIDSGTEKKSGRYERIVLRWATPYAQYLWHGDKMHGNPVTRTYGPEKLKFTEALARHEWAKYAAEQYGRDWKEAYEKAFKRRLGGE